jgi:hypothetical protein
MTDSPGWRINFEPISLNLQVEKKKEICWQLIPFLAFCCAVLISAVFAVFTVGKNSTRAVQNHPG